MIEQLRPQAMCLILLQEIATLAAEQHEMYPE